jgi:hypothetical protein
MPIFNAFAQSKRSKPTLRISVVIAEHATSKVLESIKVISVKAVAISQHQASSTTSVIATFATK